MIAYDPRTWLRPVVQFHRADTFRKLLPLLLVVGLYTWGIGYLELRYLKLTEESFVSNITVMHSILGFALSLLLVFRTNTAYDRWWEGRKLWGQLVNVSRNLAVRVSAYLPEDGATRDFYARCIAIFAHEMRLHLQDQRTAFELVDDDHPELWDMRPDGHVPAQVVKLMQQRLQRLRRDQHIDGDQLIVLNTDLTCFLDICGACERIKNTPIPYTYSAFIKKFIVVYVLTLPMGFVFSLNYWAIPVVMFIFYVLASLELIAEEIEEPFGTDENDLPQEKLAAMIRTNVADILA